MSGVVVRLATRKWSVRRPPFREARHPPQNRPESYGRPQPIIRRVRLGSGVTLHSGGWPPVPGPRYRVSNDYADPPLRAGRGYSRARRGVSDDAGRAAAGGIDAHLSRGEGPRPQPARPHDHLVPPDPAVVVPYAADVRGHGGRGDPRR